MLGWKASSKWHPGDTRLGRVEGGGGGGGRLGTCTEGRMTFPPQPITAGPRCAAQPLEFELLPVKASGPSGYCGPPMGLLVSRFFYLPKRKEEREREKKKTYTRFLWHISTGGYPEIWLETEYRSICWNTLADGLTSRCEGNGMWIKVLFLFVSLPPPFHLLCISGTLGFSGQQNFSFL